MQADMRRGSRCQEVIPNSIQFFLRDRRDEVDVLRVLGGALGFVVDSTDVKAEGALGHLQMDEFRMGFNQGCLVSWPVSAVHEGDVREVARSLADSLNTEVLLEVTDGSGQWLLTTPGLEQRAASVVMLDDGIDTAA